MKSLEFNPDIKELLLDFNLDIDLSLNYLLAVYHGLDTTMLYHVEFKTAVAKTGITFIGVDGKQEWKTPLFIGQETAFEWVKTYCELFKRANKAKGGKIRESTAKMKKMFSKNPEIRKDEVLGATQMYINNINDVSYLMYPNYFISKGIGAEKTENLLDWIDKYREQTLLENGDSTDLSNTMQ